MRVASLLPSATDVVIALDKASLLVARSHEVCGVACFGHARDAGLGCALCLLLCRLCTSPNSL